MAATPQYLTIPSNGHATLTIGVSALTGANATLLFQAGANGGRLDTVRIQAIEATTIGMIRFFSGVNIGIASALILEVPVVAATPGPTQPAWSAEIELGWILAANQVISVTTENSETFAVMVKNGGSF